MTNKITTQERMNPDQISELVEAMQAEFNFKITNATQVAVWHSYLSKCVYNVALDAFSALVSNPNETRILKRSSTPIAVFREYYNNELVRKYSGASKNASIKTPSFQTSIEGCSPEAQAFYLFLRRYYKGSKKALNANSSEDMVKIRQHFGEVKMALLEEVKAVNERDMLIKEYAK